MKGWKTLLLSATLLGGTLAAAQSALVETPNAALTASFYRGDPASGGTLLETVMVNNSPAAAVHEGVAGHTFVTLTFEGESYTVATFPGGTDKFGVFLNPSGVAEESADYAAARESATSLAELLDDLAADSAALERLTASAAGPGETRSVMPASTALSGRCLAVEVTQAGFFSSSTTAAPPSRNVSRRQFW